MTHPEIYRGEDSRSDANAAAPDTEAQGTTALVAAYALACRVVPASALFAETEVRLEDMRRRAAAKLEPLLEELRFIALFAETRSKDDSKTFARVNRAALRGIAERARAALAKATAQ